MIIIVDYKMGNLRSVMKAFKRIGVETIISSESKYLEAAQKIVLPGVGHFKRGIENLSKLGLIDILKKKVIQEKIPILGICLGMQLLTKFSEEGNVDGLGWFDAKTIKFKIDQRFKIPHIGWNTFDYKKENTLFSGVDKNTSFYFVHSYHVQCNNSKDILTTTNYGMDFASAIQKDNILGVQFHPEKSRKNGLKILKNFAEKI